MQIWVQEWEESERGWGTRSDGYTLHSKKEDIEIFLSKMREKESQGRLYSSGWVPEEYSRPCGFPFLLEITDPYVLGNIAFSENGYWVDTPVVRTLLKST